jgi:dihydroorotate dehydrogenase electron transfer subunit
MVLSAPYLARVSVPGQFCLLKAPGVFLKRPLSIFNAGGSELEFLYRVVGKGTKSLSSLGRGEAVEVLGPLGTGYDTSRLTKGTEPVLIAGGTGVASLHFLARKLRRPGILFYGAKSKKELISLTDLKKLGWKIVIATEDGSQGFKGYVTPAFARYQAENPEKEKIMFACGPHVMLERVAAIAREHNIHGYVSLVEMMACGVGNCQGCAVSICGEYIMVCKDGPVFDIRDVDWK